VAAQLPNRLRAADAAVGLDEFDGAVGCAALLAYIAVLVLRAALWACALDIPVGEVTLAVLTVCELDVFRVYMPCILQALEDELRVVPILGAVGGVVAVVVDLVSLIVFLVFLRPLGDKLLGAYALLRSRDLYRRAMCVLRTAVERIVTTQFQEPDIDVGLRVLK